MNEFRDIFLKFNQFSIYPKKLIIFPIMLILALKIIEINSIELINKNFFRIKLRISYRNLAYFGYSWYETFWVEKKHRKNFFFYSLKWSTRNLF